MDTPPPVDRDETTRFFSPEAKAGEPAVTYHCRRCDTRHGAHMFHANGECRSRTYALPVNRDRAVGAAHGDQLPPRPRFEPAPDPRFSFGPPLPAWAEPIRRRRDRRR